jgi:hypothetical protein
MLLSVATRTLPVFDLEQVNKQTFKAVATFVFLLAVLSITLETYYSRILAFWADLLTRFEQVYAILRITFCSF